jgi:hypothetical protein
MAAKKTGIEDDAHKVLAALENADSGMGEATSSEIRDRTRLTLPRVNAALDALRRGGQVVESTSVRSTRDGDFAEVWEVASNRGWAKVWILRSAWDTNQHVQPPLPNGRERLPTDAFLRQRSSDPVPASFRANWEADD